MHVEGTAVCQGKWVVADMMRLLLLGDSIHVPPLVISQAGMNFVL